MLAERALGRVNIKKGREGVRGALCSQLKRFFFVFLIFAIYSLQDFVPRYWMKIEGVRERVRERERE